MTIASIEKPQQSTQILQAQNLVKRVQSPEGLLTILDGVDFSVNRAESVAVVGASGSGKSTLLGLLAGLDLPTSGQVSLNGHAFSQMDEDGRASLRGELIGFVFQSFHLLPSLSALENVALPLELQADADALDKAEIILKEVGLAARIKHLPSQLSGGEQQRVAIARAFVTRPKLLLADEPTGNLDQHTGEKIIELLFKLNAENQTTLVLVTHDTQLAGLCQRRLPLDHGRIVQSS